MSSDSSASVGISQGSNGAYKHGHGDGGESIGGGLQMATQPLVATLRAHTRPINDVAWSPMEPSVLATSSADAKTLLWDMRSPQRPVQTLIAIHTNVIQVEWNRVDTTSLATAHDGVVRVWDLRATGERTVAPVGLITAHMQKIYGLDWHPQRTYELLTCSEDKTVKFWNAMQPNVCQGMLTTGAPVWKAQYTPFGDGLVTISQRMDNTIRLWALSHGEEERVNNEDTWEGERLSSNPGATVTAELVHSFVGHGDSIKGMAMRVRPQASVYQLVSWSKDQELRLWHVDGPQLEACGFDTASYLADVALSEGHNNSARQQLNAQRLLHAEFAEMHAHHSKYSLSALKTDFMPLVVPKSAVPLRTDEYTLDGNDGSLQALMALEEELTKGEESHSQSACSEDEGLMCGIRDKNYEHLNDIAGASDCGANTSGARALPCPRISGAAFSGPNMLLVFDSRVAIGQSRSSSLPIAVPAGKESKPQASFNKLPRTYEELLDLRDSRFATKKNKKPPVKLLSSGNMMSTMDVGTTDWTGQQQAQELIDGGVGVYGDDAENLGYRHATRYYSSSSGTAGGNDGLLSGVHDMESSIHSGSDYLTACFLNADYHVPVNISEHLLSMPTNTAAGLQPSPRLGIRSHATERLKRVEQAAPALNLDLSISVTVLDLSKLCGVSSILTYQSEVVPRGIALAALLPPISMTSKRKKSQVGAPNRPMISWMLRAAERIPGKHGASSKNHLTRVLEGLISEGDAAAKTQLSDGNVYIDNSCNALAAKCAQNAVTAMLAGRRDLQRIWALLEISAAPDVELPIYRKKGNLSMSLSLQTAPPWSAHPLGKRLVHKVLGMYEQAGDVQALASIVCTLQPSECKKQDRSRDTVTPSAITMQGQLPVVREDRHFGSGTSDTIMNSASASASASVGIRSRHSSSNMLSQLVADSNDPPPVMRGARRSSSHSEPRLQGPLLDKDATLRALKDWPSASSGISSGTFSRHSSPNRDDMLGNTSNVHHDKKVSPVGWKMDFERLENPFKTWSGNSGREAPPPRLTADTFRPPIHAVNEKSPSPSMTASPRVKAVTPSPLQGSLVLNNKKEEVDANDRVLLQLSVRSMNDEKRLLSSNPEDEARYDVYKEAYADVLYRYGAMNLRSEVLKTKFHGAQDPRGISMGLVCASCNTKTIDLVCSGCRDFAMRCSVCQLVVRGQSMFCMTCGHGGHAAHLRGWFEIESTCPTGCGCWCKQATATMPPYQHEEQEPDTSEAPPRSHSF